jgi:energy-coupling factor transporter ATP-binding protein EcfA2
MTIVTKLHFQKLKRLENVTIEFPEKGVIALLGENGTGKTTVLHALACLYKPHPHLQIERGDFGNWWTDWFVPHTGNFWRNSELKAHFTEIPEGITYKKLQDRWSPRKDDRQQRYTRYIGFKDCMPHIEEEYQRSRFEFNLQALDLSAAKRNQLLGAARRILNRNYQDIQRATKGYGLGRFLYATILQGQPPTNSSYTSHYMGAGEQKVLKIIEEVVRAPNGAMLLFEEFEVAIHESALRRFIPWLAQQADEKNLQIIVSTHWPRMTEFHEQIHLRTLHTTPTGGITCINGFKPSTMHRLTGDLAELRLITVWVEDKLAKKIVEQIASELKLSASVTTKLYGAINNSFSVAAALELDEADKHQNIVVLDGDRYRTVEEKLAQLRHALSGTGEQINITQNSALAWFVQFNPVMNDLTPPQAPMKPERFLLDAAMRSHLAGHTNAYIQQFFEFAAQNIFDDPDKTLIYNYHRHIGQSIDRIEHILVETASHDESWNIFRQEVRGKIIAMATALDLDPNVEAQ